MAEAMTRRDEVWQTPATRRWKTRELVLVAVLAVVFGFLYMQWLPVWSAARLFGAQIGQEAIFGFWFIAALLAAYIVRKPGAALAGETLAALAEILFGAPAGPTLLLVGLAQGVGAEAVFAATRYRRWGLGTLLVAAVVASLVALPYNWYLSGYFALEPGLLVAMLLARLLGALVVPGLVSRLIGDALQRAGALSGFAIGREREQAV